MKVDWAKLKTTIERALHSAEKGEQGSIRVHVKSAESQLKGAKEGPTKELLDHLHKAGNSIDVARAVEYLKKAQALVAPLAGAAPAPPPPPPA